jgi:rhodanese-related sulfurtransferase
MNTITRDELKARLDSREPVQLMMALGRQDYERLHIPGSINFENWEDAAQALSREQELVIYCANPYCPASVRAYLQLEKQGFTRLARFAGGIEEWMAAGFPLAGSLASS